MGKTIWRRRAVGAAFATLALALVVPASAFAYDGLSLDVGPLNVQRDCGAASGAEGADAQGQCSYNLAQPSGGQDASARSVEGNGALTLQGNGQEQINVLEPDASISNYAMIGAAPMYPGSPQTASVDGGYYGGGMSPSAVSVAESGDVLVRGHDADVDMAGLRQTANAGTGGIAVVGNRSGDVVNLSGGPNVAVANAGALNNTNSLLAGGAGVSADGATLGGDGGNGTGNEAGDAARAGGFGLDGGFGGSNVNLALGLSGVLGGNGGAAGSSASQSIAAASAEDSVAPLGVSSCNTGCCNNGCGGGFFGWLGSRNGEAESWASGGSGYAASDFGAQANPTQNAGSGGAAWFTLNGDGGAVSGANNANGGAGSLANSNLISGSSTATGWAQGGTTGVTNAGNWQEGYSGANSSTVSMTGGVASNTLDSVLAQSDAVTGYSGGVTNSGSPSVCAGVTVDQYGDPGITMSNAPVQSAYNTATTSQSAASGAQTVSPFQSVSSGAQASGNIGVQDALKAQGSDNTNITRTFTDNSKSANIQTGNIGLQFGH